ncbi:HAMP domain-containing sensor histidine kinase [Flectobacillus sp. BAB-3569]|uniref:sensor histidine kinase n=1 Tax=Flectobacillus sp. BAB-3569 TaxID=1509483 RepID=UPI000BA4DF4E|nr:HAMP domain-containing sensor histidine kinase [Flectobacillus sp. BAB-3569]PAC32611.1 hypothetical protein BWI92_05270 [Flectobacillus sp. BAB-3569]
MKKSVLAYRNRRRLEFVLCFLKTLLIFLLFEENLAYGQPLPSLDKRYNIETFDESKGLFNKDIYGLVFDKYGLGWLGNSDGLHIFDGKRVYSSKGYLGIDNPLLNQPVKALIYDSKEHKLLVFSFAEGKTNIYVLHLDRLSLNLSQPPLTLMISRHGPLVGWPIYDRNRISCIINGTPTFLDIKNFQIFKIQISTLEGRVFFKDLGNRLILDARDGYNYQVCSKSGKVHLKYLNRYDIIGAELITNSTLFSHLYSPLNVAIANKKLIESIIRSNSTLKYPTGLFQGIVKDPLGNFYLCSRDWGLQKLSIKRDLAKRIKSTDETRAIFYQKKFEYGWVATARGMRMFSLKKGTIPLLNVLKNRNKPLFYYECSVSVNDSLILFFPLYPQNNPRHQATLINKNTNKASLISLQYPDTINHDNKDNYLQFTIATCKKAADGNIYLGTNRGLCTAQFKGDRVLIKPIGIRKNDLILNILDSKKAKHLILATELGLYEVNLYTQKVTQLKKGSFLSLLNYSDGWVAGSRQVGAYFFDNNNKVIGHLNTDNGLNSNTVYSILYDPKFYTIWLGTGNGLTMYNLKNFLLKTYFEKDGLVHNEFNRESTYMIPEDSLILMGGLAGISVISNRNYFFSDINKIKPLVWGVDATYDSNQHRFSFISSGRLASKFAPKLRKLVFHVANFASEQQLYGVLYRVDNGEWLNLKQGEDIELLDVDSGTHKLEIKGMTADGKTSPISIIEYEVSQIWYKSWWGISLFTLLGALSMIPLFLIRNRIVQVKAKEELYKNREKLFGMIAHDLRSPLSAYQGLAGVVNYLISKQEWTQLQKIGQEIDDTGRHLDLMLNNLLNWSLVQQKSLKPIYHHTTIGTIIHEMLPVYKTVAGSKDITLDKNIDKEVTINTDANLSALIIRNLLDNAVKNAPEKSTIKIEITKKDKKLTLLIENDFHEHKLPVVTDIVANINDPEWELKRGVGLKFVMQTLKLLKASIQVSILNNKNRIRWYVEIPEP